MVDCTGDFLGQRLKKDVFPFLFDYLEKHRNSSLLSSRMYQFSPTCKLQTRLLALVNSTIQRLGLSNEILWKAAVVSSCYLDCRQPLVLQIVSDAVFLCFKILDATPGSTGTLFLNKNLLLWSCGACSQA